MIRHHLYQVARDSMCIFGMFQNEQPRPQRRGVDVVLERRRQLVEAGHRHPGQQRLQQQLRLVSQHRHGRGDAQAGVPGAPDGFAARHGVAAGAARS